MNGTIISELIDQALMEVHTAFVAKVVSVDGNMATVQPLNMIKAVGGQAMPQAVIECCPVLQNARKFVTKTVTSSSGGDPSHTHTVAVWEAVPPVSGDVVFCVCADRDISETRAGTMALPAVGHHPISAAVVVGIL